MDDNENFMKEDPWNVNRVAFGNENGTSEDGNKNGLYFSAEDMGKISMACGIISFFFYHFVFAIFGLILGIMSHSRSKNSSATIGIVCSIITLSFSALFFLGIAAIILALVPTASEWFSKLKDYIPSIYGL